MQKNALAPKTAAPGPRTKAAGVTKKATAAANADKKTKAAAAKEKKATAAEKKKKATAASNEKKKQKRKAGRWPAGMNRDAPVNFESESERGGVASQSSPSSSVSRDPPAICGGNKFYASSSSSVSSTRDPRTQCGGVWTQKEVAAREAEREVQRKVAKAKVAKQQAKTGTKLSAAALKKAEEREMWMMEKKERKRKGHLELQEFVAYAGDQTVHAMRARELEQVVPDPWKMQLYDFCLKDVDTTKFDERQREAKEEKKKASPKKASPKKASPKKASPKKASPKKASPKKKTT
jgi:hypothetical protein